MEKAREARWQAKDRKYVYCKECNKRVFGEHTCKVINPKAKTENDYYMDFIREMDKLTMKHKFKLKDKKCSHFLEVKPIVKMI